MSFTLTIRAFSLAGSLAVLIAAAVIWPGLAPSAMAEDRSREEWEAMFDETATNSAMPMTLENGELKGPGADFLIRKGSAARFVMFGEEHGIGTIADIATAYVSALRPAGFTRAAIETDPWMGARLETILRKGGMEALREYFRAPGNKLSIPLYFWEGDARFAEAVIANAGDDAPALFGLDQVFTYAAETLLSEIATRTVSAEARAKAGELAARARAEESFLGKAEPEALQSLRALLDAERDRQLIEIVDAMIGSAAIYAPFVGESPTSIYEANFARETLMKRNLMAALGGLNSGEDMPRIFLKFGAWHLYRGLSPTLVPALGGFVADLALIRGEETFSVVVLCGPGAQTIDLSGNAMPCNEKFEEDSGRFAEHVADTGLTVFDLSWFKKKPKRLGIIPEAFRDMVLSYDALVIVPNAEPAVFVVPPGE